MSGRASRSDTQADISVRECLESRQSFLMTAGAGSGKTTSLIKALAYLGNQHGAMLRRNGQRIACITYTNVAVAEIWADVDNDVLFHVSTIHSFLWEIAKPFQREIGVWVAEQIREKIDELNEKNSKPRTHETTKRKNRIAIQQYEDARSRLSAVRSFRYETDRNYAEGILGHADIIKLVPQLLDKHQLLRRIVARKYPFIFVDESQDTEKSFVESLKLIDNEQGAQFCLGFFGDQMQQIYTTGIGSIPEESGWKTITKEENFRSSKAVLDLINRIRKDGDGLEQTDGLAALPSGDGAVPGSARLFIMPMNQDRGESLDQIRRWLVSEENDPLWVEDSPEADVKVLVIVHRMAANRLGFPDLFRALHDTGPDSFKTGLKDGTLWVVRPFLQTLIPLVEAIQGNKHRVISLLREIKSPLLTQDRLIQESNPANHLASINNVVNDLVGMMSQAENSAATVKECLKLVLDADLIRMDDRIINIITDNMTGEMLSGDGDYDEGDGDKMIQAIEAFLNCPASQLWPYHRYVEGASPFSTQHGVKGAEFKRVLVVLDDEEGKHNQYSFDRLLGIADPSPTDIKNKIEGKETSIDRTRRLFYVCCSRARKDLAVVLFTQDVGVARQKIVSSGILNESAIIDFEATTS
ncbi:MAG: ATP-dependent helicase [Magnetococcales bacterium]|nr:ATP-dependent helicase [Magnetococcales bacterium]